MSSDAKYHEGLGFNMWVAVLLLPLSDIRKKKRLLTKILSFKLL